jgi:hypothetical protein
MSNTAFAIRGPRMLTAVTSSESAAFCDDFKIAGDSTFMTGI